MIGREDEVREYRDRALQFNFVVIVAIVLILFRVIFLQLIKGSELRQFSESNRLKPEKILASRGILFDREGKVFVDNRAALDVVLYSQYYHFNKNNNDRLAKALRLTKEEKVEFDKKMQKYQQNRSFHSVLLKADVDKDVVAAIEMDAEGFPGIDIDPTVQRRYPNGDSAAQLLGYIGEVDQKDLKNDTKKELILGDYIGKMGIERMFDPQIRGVNGVRYVEVDAMGRRKTAEGREKLFGFVSHRDPTAGHNLHLTIDSDLQQVAIDSMKAKKFNGVVIALDPRNGEILVLLNLPSYNPSSISAREINTKKWVELTSNKARPLRNRAIQDHYPPGSTFKPFLAIAGLAEGLIHTRSSVSCSGSMPFGNRRFNCWKKHGHVDFYRSIRESCDIFYYNLGHQLGIERIAKYTRLFGFGTPTGIGIQGETKGLIPDTEWKKKMFKDIWHPGETLSVAIGQGYVTTTPIQVALAYLAIANQGYLYRPIIVKKIQSPDGKIIKEFSPELIRHIEVKPEIFQAVQEGLFQVTSIVGGTAYLSGRSKITTIAGKTGTAQTRAFADIRKTKCDQLPYEYRHHAWFAGYAPHDKPEIVVVANAEHSCHGYFAATVVRDVIEKFIRKKAVLEGRPIIEKETKPIVDKKRIQEESDEEVPVPPSSTSQGEKQSPSQTGQELEKSIEENEKGEKKLE